MTTQHPGGIAFPEGDAEFERLILAAILAQNARVRLDLAAEAVRHNPTADARSRFRSACDDALTQEAQFATVLRTFIRPG
jgi:hypothetical protein